jgi:UDP-N-acetylglucosamine--N-acetylmuramyl-(pentapeptide) pyrophosphoryl-undecaprenol N-acetylglucosamine transferase
MGALVIAAGGTGGHLYPAIAVARELAQMAPDTTVTFVGRSGGMEESVIPREGFPFAAVKSGPWRRGNILSLASGSLNAARGALMARRILKDTGATAVFSTGGFTSAPVLLAATVGGIPYVLHEPNRLPGVVNRIFGRLARRVTTGYEDTALGFPRSRTRVTGVPVRREILERDATAARAVFDLPSPACVVLALGGSQGAGAINRAVAESLPHLASANVPVAVVWICGVREFDARLSSASSAPVPVKLFGYLWNIADALAAADVVVMRAGASSVAEVLALGKPAVLVPYPYAAGDHQTRNAEALVQAGAAVMLPEKGLTGVVLAQTLSAIALDPFRRAEMGRRAAAQGRPGAARDVATEVLAAMEGLKC